MYSPFKILNVIFILVFILQFDGIHAQDSKFIRGKLISSKDKSPIPFATVLIKNKDKGVISNSDGGFRIPYELYKSDTLLLSSMGYSSKELTLESLDRSGVNSIILQEKIEKLNEVLVVNAPKKKKKRTAKDIVDLAIKNIANNYSFSPYSYVGYYRDYQIKEGEYLNLNEALLEVFDPGFGVADFKESQTRIYQYRNNKNFKTDTLASKPYDYENKSKFITSASLNNRGGNEYTILRIHDAIRNYNVNSYDFVNQLNEDFIDNHEFENLKSTSIDTIPLYSIDIYRNQNNKRVAGEIFISKNDFKIFKMNYAVFDLSKTKETNSGRLVYEIKVEYKALEGVMYPNYISFNNVFKVLQPPAFFAVDAKIHFEKEGYYQKSKLKFNKMELKFNRAPQARKALRKRNYKVWYKDKKLKVVDIKLNEDVVTLYLDKEFEIPSRGLKIKSVEEDVSIKIKRIRDSDDNLINEQKKYEDYKQFREFFVQEIKVNSKKPTDNLYMKKNKSMFSNQPVAPFENASNYWLNSPLKKE